MSIGHIQEKIKEIWLLCEKRDIYTPFIIILTAICSFYVGKISVLEASKLPVFIENIPMPKESVIKKEVASSASLDTSAKVSKTKGKYVASKTGKKYHLPGCVGAKSIAVANQVWFDSKEEAEKAGFSAAGNCKGI